MNTKSIFLAALSLESNTFTPNKTALSDFNIQYGDDMLKGLVCAEFLKSKGYRLIPSVSALGDPNGVVPLEVYRTLVNSIISALPGDGSIDGVWLNMHGSMQVEFINSGEAFLVSQIREKVGPNVPIAIILDMHANFPLTLARLANIIVGYRTAPHTDIEDCYQQAAELLDRAIESKSLPWTICVKIPMTLPGEYATTDVYPAKYIIEQLRLIDKLENVWRASYFTGMTWIDSTHGRSTLVVSGCGENRSHIIQAMQKLAENIWNARHDFKLHEIGYSPEEAVHLAAHDPAKIVFISDSGDNVTAGGSGDNAYLLKLLLAEGAQNVLVAGIIDAQAVEACLKAGIGQTIQLSIGGTLDPCSTRIQLDHAKIKYIHYDNEQATSVLISMNEIDVIITGKRVCFISEDSLKEYGANYRDYHIIVVKLGYLFPGLAKIKDKSMMVLTEGTTMLDVRQLQFQNQKRPLYPLEDDYTYSTVDMVY